MKAHAVWTLAGLCVLAISASMATAEKPAKKGPALEGIKCPVSGKPATKCSVAYQGAKVYFCCPKCAAQFKKDQKKFSAKANFQLYATKQAKLVKCIYCDKKPDPATTIEIAGTKVCFGCEGCKQQVLKSKDQIATVFSDEPFSKGFEVIKAKGRKKPKKAK